MSRPQCQIHLCRLVDDIEASLAATNLLYGRQEGGRVCLELQAGADEHSQAEQVCEVESSKDT